MKCNYIYIYVYIYIYEDQGVGDEYFVLITQNLNQLIQSFQFQFFIFSPARDFPYIPQRFLSMKV